MPGIPAPKITRLAVAEREEGIELTQTVAFVDHDAEARVVYFPEERIPFFGAAGAVARWAEVGTIDA
ncbi:hypothetical protein HYW32_00465 [Candidatus Berkelbacteria bacterium]|nr:hypothetical protein [Candidatus Berkelbacteria bacterium]